MIIPFSGLCNVGSTNITHIDTYLHTYVLTFVQPHKTKLKYILALKKKKRKLSGNCNKIAEWVEW